MATAVARAAAPATAVFLTCQWRGLLMLNYEIDPDLVAPYVPRGCEVDLHQGRTFVSLVGFRFLDTRVLGFSIPGHREFEEVNLRLYVKRETKEGTRRGVTFLRELAPRRAVCLVARWFYNEPYWTVPMQSRLSGFTQDWENAPGAAPEVEYGWNCQGRPYRLHAATAGKPQTLIDGTEEHFIAEHYWGYGRQRDGSTLEYQVEHPSWNIWQVDRYDVQGDWTALYGPPWDKALQQRPSSVFVAQGSEVEVMKPVRLRRA
jgi:uncharacterized protein